MMKKIREKVVYSLVLNHAFALVKVASRKPFLDF